MNMRRTVRSRGFSLIEMVVVIGAAAVVIGLAGTLLHGMLRIERGGRGLMNDANTLGRLARQLREDVRAAKTSRRGDATSLELSLDDEHQVAYRLERNRLLRVEQVKGANPRRESFATERLVPLAFEVEGNRVRLRLGRHPQGVDGADRQAVTIEASLNKYGRLAELVEAKK